MLDIKQLRQDPDAVAAALNKKAYDFDVAHFQQLDTRRKQADVESQELLAQRKQASKQIGELVKSGLSVDEAKAKVNETLATIEASLERVKNEAKAANDELDAVLMAVPNVPVEEVPEGADEDANVEISRWGEPRQFDLIADASSFSARSCSPMRISAP